MSDDPFFWDDLLEHIDERRVIPIVGPELLRVPTETGEVLLQRWLAEKLAARLNVAGDNLPAARPLNAVVCRHLEKGGQREDIYSRLRGLMKDVKFRTPEPLQKLAQIRHFNLYVSTTFDSLLEQALNEVRFGGAAKTHTLVYAPNTVPDLPCEMEKLDHATVFQLLGRLSASPDYAITEEDTLEFLSSLQGEARRPHLLFDELKNNHLLIIGCNFPSWLAKFFLRIAKSSRLSVQRSASEIVVDEQDYRDSDLVLFLRHFSYRSKIYQEGGAVEFINELWSRYRERHPPDDVIADPPPQSSATQAEMPAGAIFLSYSHDDLPLAQKVLAALEGAGLDVWFDKKDLEVGDSWNAKIKRNLRNCSLFVPLISANTQKRERGYFRQEWHWAAEQSLQVAEGVPFLIPVAITDAPQDQLAVPERFREVQWTSLTGGDPTREFIDLMVRLYRDFRKREKGLA